MISYSVKLFSTRRKKTIMEFLSLFSLQKRMLISLGGVDPKTIYGNIRRSVMYDGGIGFLLFKEDILVGLATIYKLNEVVAVLGLLAIKPSEQKKGYGTFLLKYVFEIAKLNGIEEIRGRVLKENTKAISFYKKFGFIFAGGESTYLISKSLI